MVNGSSKQVESQTVKVKAKTYTETLTGDQYYIFIGKDGATPGNRAATVTGRIVADSK